MTNVWTRSLFSILKTGLFSYFYFLSVLLSNGLFRAETQPALTSVMDFIVELPVGIKQLVSQRKKEKRKRKKKERKEKEQKMKKQENSSPPLQPTTIRRKPNAVYRQRTQREKDGEYSRSWYITYRKVCECYT